MEFKGIKARLQEMGAPEPKRRGRKKRRAASIDLSSATLTGKEAQAFIDALDAMMRSTEGKG